MGAGDGPLVTYTLPDDGADGADGADEDDSPVSRRRGGGRASCCRPAGKDAATPAPPGAPPAPPSPSPPSTPSSNGLPAAAVGDKAAMCDRKRCNDNLRRLSVTKTGDMALCVRGRGEPLLPSVASPSATSSPETATDAGTDAKLLSTSTEPAARMRGPSTEVVLPIRRTLSPPPPPCAPCAPEASVRVLPMAPLCERDA